MTPCSDFFDALGDLFRAMRPSPPVIKRPAWSTLIDMRATYQPKPRRGKGGK